jgi:hypothetical protein
MTMPSKEILHDLYVIQNKTDKEIGTQYGVTDVSVSKWRRKLGVLTKSQLARLGAGRGDSNLDLELDSLTPVQLAEMYSSMGQRAIAKRFNVSKPTISARLHKFGIQPISKTDRATSHQDLTEVQKEICIGTILGDGHILERGVLKVTHYYGQLDYLIHLHRMLSPLTLPIFYEEKEMDNGKLTFAFGFRTVQHSWFQSLRSIFYPDGVNKVYPESVLRSLSARSLAYWYFDDGHLDSGLPSFDVGKLSDAHMAQLLTTVGSHFSLDTYEKIPSGSCRIIGVRARSADWFFSLIRDHSSPDLLYKFPPKHWPKGTLPRLPTKTTEVQLLPKHLSDEAKQWGTLNDDDKSGLVELFTDYWLQAGFPFHVPRPEELEVLLRLEARHVIQNGEIKVRQVGQSICQAACKSIWSASSYGSKSPIEMFSDHNTLRELIQFCLKMGGIPNQSRLRAALRYWRRNGVYNFRPSAAKALVDRYCRPGGIVLDPCSGYGGRLLGALLSTARPMYVGCEPSTETFIGLRNLHAWVCQYLPDLKDKVLLHQHPAEDVTFPDSVDMVLTSPPYWKREVYSSEDTQSANRYQTYETWLHSFWSVVISKSVQCLRPGGWLVLNVDDFQLGGKSYPLVIDTIRIVEDLGLGQPEILTYNMPSGVGGKPQTESVLCWPKGQKTDYSSSVHSVGVGTVFPRCHECGRTTVISDLNLDSMCSRCVSAVIKVCWCGVNFRVRRKDHMFHDEACYARYKRTLYRQANPVSGVRVFKCRKCPASWETTASGSFKLCPKCRDSVEVESRTKICLYRHCAQTFVDTSTQNSMKFCRPEHRRREKLFKSGIATDPSYFRDPNG